MAKIIKTKSILSNISRKLKLLVFADYCNYLINRFRYRRANRIFVKMNPGISLPGPYHLYESFGSSVERYYTGGLKSAKWVVSVLERHCDLRGKRILDWGCGPGRIIRHMPVITDESCEYIGVDINPWYVEWCRSNIPDADFYVATNSGKLPFETNYVDVIYGISVFTHLSEPAHYFWFNELIRILKPGGILLITTQGENFIGKLTKTEIEVFMRNKVVIRSGVREGGRTYSAFQPAGFMKNLFKNHHILEHIQNNPDMKYPIPQDTWVIMKK